MMIITPAFPSMNSTYNVTQQTKHTILTEFEKASLIVKELNENKNNCKITWKRLFKKFPFFKAYQHFIEFQILSKDEESHKSWEGFAATKIKHIIKQLTIFDKKINGECLELRTFPKSYSLFDPVFPYNEAYYIGIRIKGGVLLKKHTIDLTLTRRKFYDLLREKHLKQEFHDLLDAGKIELRVNYRTRAQLPDQVRPKDVPMEDNGHIFIEDGASRPQLSEFGRLELQAQKRIKV